MEDAIFIDRDNDQVLEQEEAWKRALQSDINFEKRPISKYHFEDSVKVEPYYFETVQILWMANELPGMLNENGNPIPDEFIY